MKTQDVPAVVTIASGKGGVGKTTTTSDLAHKFKEWGYNVGVVDADISTPNTPSVLTGGDADFSDQQMSDGENLIPVDADGIQLMSQGLSLPDDVVLLRDGQFRSEAVAEYIQFVEWDDETDIVLVDTPPGSGEEVQVVLNAAMPNFTFIVTTSHSSSLQDAKRTSLLMEQADIPAGVVVNMSHIPSDDMLEAVWDREAVESVDGISESRGADVYDALRESAEDFPLFQSAGDIAESVGEEVIARVPYTTDEERRREALGGIDPETFFKPEMEA